jgi:cell division cycle protein 37
MWRVKLSPALCRNVVHPNVDKRSFIRWKQRDIHEKRAQRRQDMENLALSNQVNRKLQHFIDLIITRLDGATESIDHNHALAAFDFTEEELGEAPTGAKGPTYAKMLQSLFTAIKDEVGDVGNKKEAYIKQLRVHRGKIDGEIKKNDAERAKLEKEAKSKITTEGLREGFSSSVVSLL